LKYFTTPGPNRVSLTQKPRAPRQGAPAVHVLNRNVSLLLLGAGGRKGAALGDVRGLRVRTDLVELLEELTGREPLVAGVASVVAAQSRTAQIGKLLRRHFCHPGAVEVIPERLVIFRAVGCQSWCAQRSGGNESKCETLHIDLPMTANDLPIRSSDASFVARCVQIRVSPKKVSKSR